MNMIWILVINQAEAQIYSAPRLPGSLSLVQTLTHKEGSSRARELTSDAPGRVHDRMGTSRHSMEPDTGVKEEHRRRFVKEVVERLQAARLNGKFDQLVLLAAPAVLGVIRKTMSADFERAVIREIPKDVIGQGLDRIELQLQRSFELK
jgi:protein required for attachment to host cells